MNIQGDSFDVTFEPLAGFSLTNLTYIIAYNKFNITTRYLPRILYSYFLSTILTPLRIKESIRFKKIINQTTISKSPIFIIGHWRSGTTYLHNLLSINTNYGFCSTYHTTVPNAFLSNEKILKPIVHSHLPAKRPQDDADLGVDLPQEEEYGIGALFPFAYYNGWCFPKNMKFYNNFVCMNNVSDDILDQWKNTYMYLLKKITIHNKGKRLILKNPANTGRIKLLLEMFPDAKFIHIIRNPYEVYYSMKRFMNVIIGKYCVQNPPQNVLDMMMNLYNEIYESYFNQRSLIPEENLIEIAYEDLIKQPKVTIKKIHLQFKLSGYQTYLDELEQFIKAQRNVKLSSYKMEPSIKEMIYQKWKKTFEIYDYPAPDEHTKNIISKTVPT